MLRLLDCTIAQRLVQFITGCVLNHSVFNVLIMKETLSFAHTSAQPTSANQSLAQDLACGV